MKTAFVSKILVSLCTLLLCLTCFAQDDGEKQVAPETEADPSAEEAAASTKDPERTLPDIHSRNIALLKSQYPPRDVRKLNADGKAFTALWRKDQSGEAFGAVLIVPANGQTANWPHTIDVLRNDLPKNGWSTLAIDIKHLATPNIPKRQSEQTTTENAETKLEIENRQQLIAVDDNRARIKAAIEFLNSEGQFNIILAGYGNSADRVLDFAASGMKMTADKPVAAAVKMKNPVRALILINAKSVYDGALTPQLSTFPFKDIPIQDIIFGHHYLDTFDADARRTEARALRIKNYFQLKLMEPTNTVFAEENRLSRRVRGFLNKHAKGIEINRR